MFYWRARYYLALIALLLLTRCEQKSPSGKVAKRPAATHSHGDSREPVTHLDAPAGRPLRETMADLADDLTNWSALENPDHIFQDLLEIYHERARELADQELSRGRDSHLRLLADSIRRRTLGSLADLEKVHKRLHRPGADYRSTSLRQSRLMLNAMKKGQRILSTPIEASTLDQQYVAYMDLYYQSGLLLANTQIRYGREAPRVVLAREWKVILQREWETIKAHRPGQIAEHP
jgi:uncharacterized protein (DUF305 family)